MPKPPDTTEDIERGRLVAWLVAEFEVQNGINVAGDESAITRLSGAADLAAAATDKYEVNLPFLSADETGPKHLHVVLTKERIDAIREGREGPPHVDRGRRSAPPPPREPREERGEVRKRDSSNSLVLALAILFLVVFAIA